MLISQKDLLQPAGVEPNLPLAKPLSDLPIPHREILAQSTAKLGHGSQRKQIPHHIQQLLPLWFLVVYRQGSDC